jgi:diguanylate cyclase (GGDEF)-like protein
MSSNDVLAKLASLRIQFQQRLPAEHTRLSELWYGWSQLEQELDRQQLLRAIHTLKGNSGTFGLTRLSQRAADLEVALDARQRDQSLAATRFTDLMAELELAASGHDNREPTFTPEPPPQKTPSSPPPITGQTERPRLAYITELKAKPDQTLLNNLSVQGYDVVQVPLSSPVDELPHWVLADLSEQQGLVRRFLGSIHQWLKQGLEVVVLIDELDFQAQLALVRAGVRHCLMRPISVDQLLRLVKPQLGQSAAFQGRVLLIDDQSDVMQYYKTLLESSGLKVRTEIDPQRVFAQIDQFDPDLALLDINMPVATGPEIARVLRLHERFETLAILFLTGDHDQASQRSDLLTIGSDDLLYKGMDETELVQLVTARAERARQLRDRVNRDALSGLNNHGALQRTSQQAFASAKRTNQPSSLVMIDLDHFKVINDRYGHDMGDQVIRTMSQVLLSRFRSTDTVGRYGGEEFVILLPETPTAQAKVLTDEIRTDLSALTFTTPSDTFTVTFSAGISDALDHESHVEQFKAADNALYQAKQSGRNRVIVSEQKLAPDPKACAPDPPA